MSLGAHWKLTIQNKVGEEINAVNIVARIRKEKFGTTGQLELAAEELYAGDNTTLGIDGFDDLGSVEDNTTDLNLGISGTLECNLSSGTPDGTIDLYLKKSSDGTKFVDDDLQTKKLLCSCVFDGTAEDNTAEIDYGV